MTPEEKKQILDGLITNGLRHLDRGLRGFESGDFDFAVTDAFFGIEIILKALVLDGQWELIFDEPGEANLAKLKAGNCRTIGLDQIEKRLTNLLNKPLPPSSAQFKNLQKHRNKLVHFFHPGLDNSSEKTLVARDLANAWGALRDVRALPVFEPVFRDHAAAFRALDGRLLIIDTFLDQQATNIRAHHPDPSSLESCPACKRETFDGDCALCGYSEPSHRELTQGADYIPPADCPQCGAVETVVASGEGSRCTDCGRTFDSVGRCEYCGEPLVSVPQADPHDDMGTYFYGCPKCPGRVGELMSRDD